MNRFKNNGQKATSGAAGASASYCRQQITFAFLLTFPHFLRRDLQVFPNQIGLEEHAGTVPVLHSKAHTVT